MPPLGRSEHASVDLYWLPLGAGDASHCVRWNGRLFEALAALHGHREARDLYHSALEVNLGTDRFVIEMAPVWGNTPGDRGVVSDGSVGIPWLGHSRFFRYEVRRWRNGRIPDISEAVASPQRLSSDILRAERVLELVPAFPTVTWGRDELHTGDMWNSNSLTALVARPKWSRDRAPRTSCPWPRPWVGGRVGPRCTAGRARWSSGSLIGTSAGRIRGAARRSVAEVKR